MKKKLIIVLCVIGAAIGMLSVRAGVSQIRNKRAIEEYFTEGARLIAYEIREYIETGDKTSFHKAAIDVRYLSSEAGNAMGSEYNKKAFEGISEAFAQSEDKLRDHAERLAEAFEKIAEAPQDEYPYSQFNVVLNSI
ncbi:MAG: hypothetical protein PUB94_03055 [Oscillospiraceae bacterium]|nr:hypothetical protein [Oscillospiraceae bacterium]